MPIFKLRYFLITEFWEFKKLYSGYIFFDRYVFCKYFLTVSDLSFHFSTVSFTEQKILILMKSNLYFL